MSDAEASAADDADVLHAGDVNVLRLDYPPAMATAKGHGPLLRALPRCRLVSDLAA